MFSYLVKDDYLKAIPEREAIFIVFQIMKALQFLHKKLKIVHRDLKLDNILLELPIPKTKIYLCDFGIAKYLGHNNRTNTCVGTLEYSAPEVFKSDKSGDKAVQPYDFKCDIWSLGVITHILLSGVSPFYSESKEKIIKASRLGQLNLAKPQFNKVSLSGKSCIKRLLQVEAASRMDINDCFDHDWIKLQRKKLEKTYRSVVGTGGNYAPLPLNQTLQHTKRKKT